MTRPAFNPKLPLDGLTRRGFLAASGVVGAGALLAGAASVSLADVLARGFSDPLPEGTPIIVLVTLYGGNDGLNTLIPYTDSAYYSNRPGLSYAADKVLKLDSAFGLNPGMKSLAGLWGEKKLAVVRGVGYPQPDRSHFRSMDIWQSGSPTSVESTGWVGRWLDIAGDDPLLALSADAIMPPVLVGANRTGAALDDRVANGSKAGASNTIKNLSKPHSSDTPARSRVVSAYKSTIALQDNLVPKLPPAAPTTPEDPGGGDGAAAPDSDLGQQFDVVSRCIRAGAPSRVYVVSTGGFDTHAEELDTQAALLESLDTALGWFRRSLGTDARSKDVVVMAYSEFGRRVKANASQGTDHGTAGPVFLFGDRVKGGFYGEMPSLTSLDDGDLKYTVDFRSIYASVLTDLLSADSVKVLPNHPAALPLFGPPVVSTTSPTTPATSPSSASSTSSTAPQRKHRRKQ